MNLSIDLKNVLIGIAALICFGLSIFAIEWTSIYEISVSIVAMWFLGYFTIFHLHPKFPSTSKFFLAIFSYFFAFWGLRLFILNIIPNESPGDAAAFLASFSLALLSPIYTSFLKCSLTLSIAISFIAVAVAIGGFANIYSYHGIVSGATNAVDYSLESALYFSVVTWTTLGYGDFHPTALVRPVTAIESLCGYVVMALLIGLTLNKSLGKKGC